MIFHLPSNTHRRAAAVRRGGFSLFELLLVISILVMMASVVGVGFRSTFRRVRYRQSMDTVMVVDQQLRRLADRTGIPCTLQIDPGTGALKRRLDGEERSQTMGVVPAGIQFWTLDPDSGDFRLASSVIFETNGGSDDYIVVAEPGSCLLVLGASGQSIDVTDPAAAKSIILSP